MDIGVEVNPVTVAQFLGEVDSIDTGEGDSVARSAGRVVGLGLDDGYAGVAGGEHEEALVGAGIANIGEGDVEGGSFTRMKLTLGGNDIGYGHIRAVGRKDVDGLEGRLIVLCPDGEFVFAGSQGGGQRDFGQSCCIGIGGGNEIVFLTRCNGHVGVGDGLDAVVDFANAYGRRGVDRHYTSLTEPRHE